MASKLCDSCKSATAALYCRPDAAFLCLSCDSKVHAANKLASRRARVWMCEVCEQAPAHVTCKADAAALCVTCDRDIHSANPLARRHERVPVTPFYDSVSDYASLEITALSRVVLCRRFQNLDLSNNHHNNESTANDRPCLLIQINMPDARGFPLLSSTLFRFKKLHTKIVEI